MDFEEKRQQLLKEAYTLEESVKFNDSYKRRFFELVEDVILYLLQTQDVFFGQFMLRVRRNININLTVPIATIPNRENFNMYFNPFLFLNCSKREMAALFKHEIYHIMNSHFERERKLKNRFNKEAINVALDISINQYIKDLPGFSKRLHAINMEYKLSLEENRSIEEYAEKIYKSIKSRIKESTVNKDDDLKYELDMSKAHDLWEEIQMSEEDIKNLTKKTAISAYNPNTPQGLETIILAYKEKAEIPWQVVLKNILPTVKSGYKKTITRRDRRQPDRLDLRGRLPKSETELIVAIDISASINDDDMHKILIEIVSITSNTKNKITIIECDNEIRSIYLLKDENDIRKRSKDNGSTEFTPVFQYINDNNLRDSVLIYFTDGVGEKELGVKPINKKSIWVISGNEELSLKRAYGEIKRINTEVKEVLEGNIGLKMVNEAIHEWAR
ncbi:VWA-like domain-containing protein [Clostridium sp.]|uniref:vWA domain-containing protein n=1 Tax=Clostridium sp. TaxID=1506 RepID=UPI00283BD188|nr:VWA-like domain-containing protein [Clostridium sp.]MDR3596050.1 VWA-like domain-containing protein [Clostridium sp.]